jgi:pimeloyl-ACP methyl ester carboxylesterase
LVRTPLNAFWRWVNSSKKYRTAIVTRNYSIALTISLTLLIAMLLIWWRFDQDIKAAHARAVNGSVVIATHCGSIEYQEVGSGKPLLVVHGSGGGHDQGVAFADALAQQGIRVIAMSRFGYLRTPRPADASPAAQADAHVCLMDALNLQHAAVLGASAGGPSAMQTAIRHPDRVSALALVVPIAYKPSAVTDSSPPLSPWTEKVLMKLIGSDFVFWVATKLARDQVIKRVLATPPELLEAASAQERARVNVMVENILPVSVRAQGLRDDSALGKSLTRYPLESIRAPTLIISARDDGFGTYASAQYTASQIKNAKFIGFEQGGHVLVGHDETVRSEIVNLLHVSAQTFKP